MTAHEPFPIADYQDGLMLPREPWLSPRNAFRTLNNGRVYRGRLEKRTGFQRLAELCQDASDQSVFAFNFVGSPLQHSYRPGAGERCVPETVTFRSDNGTAGAPYINAELDPGSGQWIAAGTVDADLGTIQRDTYKWDIFGTSTVTKIGFAYWDPDASVTHPFVAAVYWELHPSYVARATDEGEMFYRRNPLSEVIGLTRFQNTLGDFSLAADQDYLYKYDPGVGYYAVLGGVAFDSPRSFSGSDENYFWFWPMEDYVLFTNGIDPVCRWDPSQPDATSISEQPTNFTGGAGNDLTTALLVIRFKGRVVYLNTNEGGTVFPRRARFTAAGSYTVFDSDLDFTDAPAELGDIVTAEFIGARCFVGFEKGWMELVSTGDAAQPFEWEPFISRFGAVSKLSTIKDNVRLLSRSATTMQAIDPNGQYYFDAEIPDLVKQFDPAKTDLCAAARNEDQRCFWWTMVDQGGTKPTKVLSATYDEKSNVAWSVYDLSFNVFSDFDAEQTPTWDSLGPLTWDDLSGFTWDDVRIGTPGFTQSIGGGSDGAIYKFSQVQSDQYISSSPAINFEFETQRLTPYPGARAHMMCLDIYADTNSAGLLTLEFFGDSGSSPYLVRTVDFTPRGTADKGVRRVRVNRTALFHSIKGKSSDGNPIIIDALIPWFRPAGRMREVN